MIATERIDVAASYIQRIRELVTGKRIMPEVNYGDRDNAAIHLSDCVRGSCLAIPYYRLLAIKEKREVPEPGDESCLFFLRGRVIERCIAQELAPQKCEGILYTIDDNHPVYGLGEVKSTASDMSKFKPESAYDHWLSRIQAYCYASKVRKFNLIVLFLIGNTASHKWANPNRKTVDIKAWTLEFDDLEIAANWSHVRVRRDELLGAINDDRPLDVLMVHPKDYECKSCNWRPTCQYYSGKS